MFLGAEDFTPGAMLNAQKPLHDRIFVRPPHELGTRCHQLAMYVGFESPCRCCRTARRITCGTERWSFWPPCPGGMIEASMDESGNTCGARRNGSDCTRGDDKLDGKEWRLISLSAEAISNGCYQGENADRMASDYKLVRTQVTRTTKLKLSWRRRRLGRTNYPRRAL